MNALIGTKIKNLRENKNYSQEYVAQFINISQPTLARIEAGKSNTWVNYIESICKIFEIEVVDLLMPDHINVINKNVDTDKKEAVLTNDIFNKLINQYEENIEVKNNIIKDLRERLFKCEQANIISIS